MSETIMLRNILRKLDDLELDDLARFHFPQAYEKFAAGMAQPRKIILLIDYCDRRNKLPELYQKLMEEHPDLFHEGSGEQDSSFQIPNVPIPADIYVSYENAIDALMNRLGRDHEQFPKALVYSQRLRENIQRARLYKDNDSLQSERSEIIDQLNRLALSTFGMTFSELGTPMSAATAATAGANQQATATTPPATTDQRDKEHEHTLRMINEYRRQLQKLQLQAARLGTFAPPYISIEIEDLEHKIADLERLL